MPFLPKPFFQVFHNDVKSYQHFVENFVKNEEIYSQTPIFSYLFLL